MTAVRHAYRVRGRVQGVGFRHFAATCAAELGVAGFVQNVADGSVRGEVEGDSAVVEAFVAALRRGPRFAAVTAVEVEPLAPTGGAGFSVR